MNISEAKDQIEKSVRIYLMKDQYGNYRIPLERQRPVFLLGAPGIGKTAIMEQIARDLNISLVTYSMTHHTRQSALGLPFIVQRTYGQKTYDVSRYTMSEIIASVYENMEKSGKKEGILFLDEINCVSETLAPSMLQFLQYKTFGNQRVPEGWVIVTAGNPPEFNRSVREFDVVTMDRLKVLEVVPDYDVWKTYAQQQNLHKSILTYLDVKKDDFYDIESTVDGRTYVTARGWEDLSEAIYLYEEQGFTVDETLIAQYIHNPRISGEFAAYYELYNKYRADYHIHDILEGKADRMIEKRAQKASFDERISVMGLLLEAILPEIKENMETEECLKQMLPALRQLKKDVQTPDFIGVSTWLKDAEDRISAEMEQDEAANGMSLEERRIRQYKTAFAGDMRRRIRLEAPENEQDSFAVIQREFAQRVDQMQKQTADISSKLKELFLFVENNFGDGNEMLVLITELTVNRSSARFIAEKGCEEYYKYNKKFLLYERNRQLMNELEELAQQEEKEDDQLLL